MTLPRPSHYLPCRICGSPTRYHGTERNHLSGMVHCGKPECIEASRALKNANIARRAVTMYADGSRRRLTGNWSRVPRVSSEERLLAPWFETMGWTPQYGVLTGVHTNKLPRQFKLDFALPERKLYVEIDGTVHLKSDRKARDARRDQMMKDIGWIGLRIPASLVKNDVESAKRSILDFIG